MFLQFSLVDIDLDHSAHCFSLLGRMGVRLNWLGNCANWRNFHFQVSQTYCHCHTTSPAQPCNVMFYVLSIMSLLASYVLPLPCIGIAAVDSVGHCRGGRTCGRGGRCGGWCCTQLRNKTMIFFNIVEQCSLMINYFEHTYIHFTCT